MQDHKEREVQIIKIYEMRWANDLKQTVRLVADTDTGSKEEIWTPYSADSIIWDAIQAAPIEDIQPPVISDVIDVIDSNE